MRFNPYLVVTVVCLSYISPVLGGQLSVEDIKLIRSTAVEICNTLKGAEGSKTTMQLKGEISAKLNGLLKKLGDVGVSGGGKVTAESFQGLTQSATAAALKGDRECRERVFEKMFDRLKTGSPVGSIPYPAFHLTIPTNATISDGDPPGSIELYDKEFALFMAKREKDQQIFFMSISVPWDLPVGDHLSVTAIDHDTKKVNGEMIKISNVSGHNSYDFGMFTQFERGFGRTRNNRFTEETTYQGFFQVFNETCFSGQCFFNTRLVSPNPERAALTYKAPK